ncbi:MAG: pantetheine-phosphate adenylyltransferase [Nitrospinaceae bacterium]|jgi:pantetheine-phosphate adenylyltransferase|nr:pantetheine-phosphate adenylyltransferase [Nitrospinaceae bacterium]MDP6657347.1 pantetheine-phosphate adenylyltransferase [Nitrospinaceae bacterium]MDP6712563.1 pantetheine-phosphate adenylyltransferase [Nitrospinaceae bacterium]MDP7057254.1 pantetheine-phosphate adenylyltransferase [Nitrospinaceae bacterium]HAK37423.1 pantetheine-phosphate adenylyltransferase [Nitrospina sp.]|tara:strand:+ start:1164 stop:1649 length:486 start_codon:yes stop_codon:yes gene_type:complete
MKKKRIAIYPGTFDPVTNGHIDIIRRALNIFDKVIVSVALNAGKNPLFSIEQRVDFIKQGLKGLKNVTILPFDNLLIDFAQANNASVIIKGLRAVSDFEYELQMGLMNRNLDESLETLFMIPSQEHAFLSSSFVKEIAKHGGDIHKLVPKIVAKKLSKMSI